MPYWTNDSGQPISAANLNAFNAETVTLDDATASNNTIKVTPTANKSNSTSVGGAILINNTGSTGAGLVIYSAQASPAGRLFVVRVNNVNFGQAAAHIETNGTSHGLTISHTGSGTSANALSVTSTNASDTSLGVVGNCDSRGTVKITHNKSGTDTNASCISLLINGSGTACQGIFLDTETGVTTTGKLINFRQNGVEKFVVYSDGTIQIGAGPRWTYGTGSPEGAVTASVGSMYSRTDGGAGTTLYVKESGTGNTGWVAK